MISACLGLLSILPLSAQSLVLDGVGVGPAVTVTGGGGPPSSAVELFRNGVSVGSAPTTAGGQFSFTNVTTALNDSFEVGAGQVWNFNTNGNVEGWSVGADTSLVTGGIWKQTETANASDMTLNLYGDNVIKTKARALEIRMRFQGSGTRQASLIIQSAGPNGAAGGGDDVQSFILNTVTLQNNANYQTFVFDLGMNHAGASTCWLDSTAPIQLSLYIPSTNIGNTVEVDSIRLTESLRWNFDSNADLSEWQGNPNTALSATSGVLKMQAAASGSVAMFRPFRNIGSSYFNQLETRFRQVTTQQPNLISWQYVSNPAAYSGGGFQVNGTPADGNFQTINLNLSGTPTYGNLWGAGGGATLNSPTDAFTGMFANAAGNFTEVDYIRLHPAVRYGPSLPVIASGTPVPPSYYVSFTSGNDLNSGRTPATAWKTFTNLDGLTLGPGSTVYLKRGDVWANRKLTLSGKGMSGNPIKLTAYGEGNRPRITGINLTAEPCIVWNNPSFVNIDSMDCRDAKIGLFLRYTGGNLDGTGAMFNNTDVNITHCYFKNMDEVWSDVNGAITVQPPYEISWGTGIWIGGNIPSPPGGPWASTSTPILNNLTVRYCGFDEVSQGLGMNFYYPPVYRSRFTNLIFEDSWVTGCEAGSMALFSVDGGRARRVDTFRGGNGFYNTGTTGGLVQDVRNFSIEDCQFAFNKRNGTANDGVSFDYEGNTENVAFQHNVLHDSDGGGILMILTNGSNQGFNLSNNTIWNNCRNPKDAVQNVEMQASSGNAGTYTNNGIYLGSSNGIGTPGIYNNTTRWNNFTGGTNNRTTTPYSSVSSRPTTWAFTSSVESWGSANQWSGLAATGGALVGTSTGADPYISSPATWVNTRERRWVLVRMSQTAGTTAEIFFQTETFPTFTADKSVAFPIIADGVMRDYVVPLGAAATFRGVVTKWRLDPTDAAGSTMVIDSFDSQFKPYLLSVNQIASNVIDVKFNQAMLPDGGVFNPANYQLSGLGKGTASASPSTVSLISTSSEPIYRLTWNTGHTNGLMAILAVSNSTDVRGNGLWSGSQFPLTTLPEPIIDTDSDGMPDAWETAAGLNPNLATDAATDKDGDGQSNLSEYLADTNPSDPSSRFHVLRLEELPLNPGYKRVVWASRTGVVYQVEMSDTLLSGSWTTLNSGPIVATTAETFWDAAASGSHRFYRVRSFRPNPLLGTP